MFLVFALITLLGALGMLLQKNIIVAGLFMVASFFGIAGLFVLLANPVAAALQLIVYSGAIMVLVLFVIMMLSSHEEEAAEASHPIQRWLSVLLALALAAGGVKLVMASKGVQMLATRGAARRGWDPRRSSPCRRPRRRCSSGPTCRTAWTGGHRRPLRSRCGARWRPWGRPPRTCRSRCSAACRS